VEAVAVGNAQQSKPNTAFKPFESAANEDVNPPSFGIVNKLFSLLFYCFRWLTFLILLWLRILFVPLLKIGAFLFLILAIGLYVMNPSTISTVYKVSIASFVCFVLGFSYDVLIEWMDPNK
jgi:hypothetical protein